MQTLIIHCDGGSRGNPGPAASAFVVLNTDSEVVYQEGKYIGKTTNNEAEYQAVLMAIEWLIKNHPDNTDVTFVLDSELVVKQLIGVYKIRETRLLYWANKIKSEQRNFSGKLSFKNVPRIQNKIADSLVNGTLDEKNKSEN